MKGEVTMKKQSRNKWYLAGWEEGKQAAQDTDWQPGERGAAIAHDTLAEIAGQCLEHFQQMTDTIYDEHVTGRQLEQWESGFYYGFERQARNDHKHEAL